MSALGFAVLFMLSLAIAMSSRALNLEARIGRGRKVCQLPLPLDYLGSVRVGEQSPERRLLLAVVGSLLLFFAAMGAIGLGQLATMMPETAAAIFQAYPWLQSAWRPLMAFGPIVFVVMTVPGMVFLKMGIDALER